MKILLSLLLALLLCLGAFSGALAAEDEQLSRDMDAMLPALDSVLRATAIEGAGAYNPDSDEYVWLVLYLMGMNWGSSHEGVQTDVEPVVVPKTAMADFARAAFAVFDGLTEIPESMAQSVRYDEASGNYLLAGSDAGDSATRVDAFKQNENGSVTAVASLCDGEGNQILGMTFELTFNLHLDKAGNPFAYSIESAK